jgi:hypothetical protein
MTDDVLKITADPDVRENDFSFRKDGQEVAGGSLQFLSRMLQDFPAERFDEVAVHPTVYATLPWDKAL